MLPPALTLGFFSAQAWAGAAEIIAAAARGSAQNLATFGSNGRADLTELRLHSLSAPAFDTSLTLHFELQPPLPGVALPPPLRVKYSDLKSLNEQEQERRAQRRQQAEAQARLQAEKLHALQELSEHFERARQQLSAESKTGPQLAGRDCPRSPEITRDCPRAPEIARGCPRLPEVARGCPRLPEITRGCPRSPEIARDYPRLPEVHSSSCAE